MKFILLLALGFTNCYASQILTFHEMLDQHIQAPLYKPKPESDGRFQTMNRKGAMVPMIDQATEIFIASACANDQKVLEIGGAYGFVMIQTLKNESNTSYHINDICKEHLIIAAHELSQQSIEKETLDRTKYIVGNITDENFTADGPYDAILISRVLHFFTPDQLSTAIDNMYKLLKPNGHLYAVAITPYVNRYKSFIPVYEKRLTEDETYPGFVNNLLEYINEDVTPPDQISAISCDPFMFLDSIVLKKLFKEHGFSIKTCETFGFAQKSEQWSLDGRENVYLIATKTPHQ